MSYAEGWDPDRWDALNIVQPTGQIIRTEMGGRSTHASRTIPAESDQLDNKVTTPVRRLLWFLKLTLLYI